MKNTQISQLSVDFEKKDVKMIRDNEKPIDFNVKGKISLYDCSNNIEDLDLLIEVDGRYTEDGFDGDWKFYDFINSVDYRELEVSINNKLQGMKDDQFLDIIHYE